MSLCLNRDCRRGPGVANVIVMIEARLSNNLLPQ
jgi:hypothetical protein